MIRFLFPLLFLAFFLLQESACFSPPTPACAFACTENQCADGYRCASDGWCKRNDIDDNFSCGTTLNNDATTDVQDAASLTDATSEIDAMPQPDATSEIDAMPQSDAALPDAALPDAALPDAAAP